MYNILTDEEKFTAAFVTVACSEDWHFCKDFKNKVHITALNTNIMRKNATLRYVTSYNRIVTPLCTYTAYYKNF